MKISKKALGAAMSVVMLGSQVMPVLASGSAVPTAPTTTGGTANILDYKVESVVDHAESEGVRHHYEVCGSNELCS